MSISSSTFWLNSMCSSAPSQASRFAGRCDAPVGHNVADAKFQPLHDWSEAPHGLQFYRSTQDAGIAKGAELMKIRPRDIVFGRSSRSPLPAACRFRPLCASRSNLGFKVFQKCSTFSAFRLRTENSLANG